MKNTSFRILTMVTLALLLATNSIATVQARSNTGVLPPKARLQGRALAEWTALHWEYIMTLPASESPFLGNIGTGCIYQRVGNVALIAIDWGRPEIICEVPAGVFVNFMIVGAECSTLEPPPFYGANEEELRNCALSVTLTDLMATIDGLDVQEPERYIFTSPLYEFTLPEDNFLGLPGSPTGESVGYSFYLSLTPLNPGVHMLHLYGYVPEYDFASEYHINLIVNPNQ